jgi:hypothetical protein
MVITVSLLPVMIVFSAPSLGNKVRTAQVFLEKSPAPFSETFYLIIVSLPPTTAFQTLRLRIFFDSLRICSTLLVNTSSRKADALQMEYQKK